MGEGGCNNIQGYAGVKALGRSRSKLNPPDGRYAGISLGEHRVEHIVTRDDEVSLEAICNEKKSL